MFSPKHSLFTLSRLIVYCVCVQISSWSSTPPAPCWPSSMAAPLLQSWTWAQAAAAPAPPIPTSSPPPALLPLWRQSHLQSCWTPARSWSSQSAALWSAWSLWQRLRPARRPSSTCVNWVLVARTPTPPCLTDCEQQAENWWDCDADPTDVGSPQTTALPSPDSTDSLLISPHLWPEGVFVELSEH